MVPFLQWRAVADEQLEAHNAWTAAFSRRERGTATDREVKKAGDRFHLITARKQAMEAEGIAPTDSPEFSAADVRQAVKATRAGKPVVVQPALF